MALENGESDASSKSGEKKSHQRKKPQQMLCVDLINLLFKELIVVCLMTIFGDCALLAEYRQDLLGMVKQP